MDQRHRKEFILSCTTPSPIGTPCFKAVATSIASDSVLQHPKAVNQSCISHQETASAFPVLQSEVVKDLLSTMSCILNRGHDCM